jgi:hypothetical protein
MRSLIDFARLAVGAELKAASRLNSLIEQNFAVFFPLFFALRYGLT